MSSDNVEVVRKAYEAFAHGDLTAVLNQLDPAVLSYTAAPLPDPTEHHGLEGFLEWVENWTGTFDEFEMEVQEYISARDMVVVCALQRATGAASGVPVAQTFWLVHTVEHGKIARIGIHATKDQALEAAGVSE